jgi:endoglucanase
LGQYIGQSFQVLSDRMSRSRKLRCLRTALSLALVAAVVGCSFNSSSVRRNSPAARQRASVPEDGYLRGVDGKLVDSAGRPAKLTGVSWFGFETASCAPHGLSARNWQDMLDQMRNAGFNALRIPYSNQFLDDPTCLPTGVDYNKNPDLQGLQGLALLDKIVDGAGRRGLRVILDRHVPSAGVPRELWYTDQVPPTQWIGDWVMLARHYQGNHAVIGADLANEPHGAATWGDGNASTDWRLAAEGAGDAILAANPDWLILVQGVEYYNGDPYWWGGQLQGASSYPVRLSHPDKLVYSPHDYGPSLGPQAWFQALDFPQNLPQVWSQHWGNLAQLGTPLLIGEFGGGPIGDRGEDRWQRSLMSYLNERGIGSIYWAWNADSVDTDGMLEADWQTINRRQLNIVMGRRPPP